MIFYFNHSASTSSDSQFESFENLMYNIYDGLLCDSESDYDEKRDRKQKKGS